jgi:hypothetical protein
LVNRDPVSGWRDVDLVPSAEDNFPLLPPDDAAAPAGHIRVMPALGAGSHAFPALTKAWMAGPRSPERRTRP